MFFPSILRFICKLLLSKKETEHLHNFQKTYRPSMSVTRSGTLTMSLEDAHAARMEKNRRELIAKYNISPFKYKDPYRR